MDARALKDKASQAFAKGKWGKAAELAKAEGAEVRVELAAAAKEEFDPNAPPIEDELRAIWADVPEEEWKRLPADLTDHLDHYIYGTPK